MKKFQKTLVSSSKHIKAARAKIISENAEAAQEDILRLLKKQLRDIDSKLLGLTDIHPDSELSLKVVTANFNAEELFRAIHTAKIEKANKTIEVGIAQETYDEWFTDEENES
jgi:DNA-directed RNA polymerase subunit K/omega